MGVLPPPVPSLTLQKGAPDACLMQVRLTVNDKAPGTQEMGGLRAIW